MAEYYTQFSIEIKDLTEAEREWIKENIVGYTLWIADEVEDKLFDYEFEGNGLWIYSEEYGLPEAVADFVQDFFKKFRLQERKVFGWANTCSKPRADAFSGGSVLVTARGQLWSRIIASSEDLASAAAQLAAVGG